MKKVLIGICLFVFCCVSSSAYAHPPSKVEVRYDVQTKILSAVITHTVSNPETHHIFKVEVKLNGKTIIKQAPSRQDDQQTLAVSYRIPDKLKKGDTFLVTAECNRGGDNSGSATIR